MKDGVMGAHPALRAHKALKILQQAALIVPRTIHAGIVNDMNSSDMPPDILASSEIRF